ncbi:hypothetical protein ABT186_47320 [Streptomyces sp. NPDC001634]|uniref:hypothetical protein n=1 Tax=Streptomyces sp. NPDC001634 TaxID=3154390 RepID=UPI00331D4CC3
MSAPLALVGGNGRDDRLTVGWDAFRGPAAEVRGGHVRLPVVDDEIIDRAVAIQSLAAREVRLLTCDTGQHTRGRAVGLKVTRVPREGSRARTRLGGTGQPR